MMTIEQLLLEHPRIVERIREAAKNQGRAYSEEMALNLVFSFEDTVEGSRFWNDINKGNTEIFYKMYPEDAVFPADAPAYSTEQKERLEKVVSDDAETPPAITQSKGKPVGKLMFTTHDRHKVYNGQSYFLISANDEGVEEIKPTALDYGGHLPQRTFRFKSNAELHLRNLLKPTEISFDPDFHVLSDLDQRQKDLAPHYDNSKGSLYKVATERNWNAYLFDVVKRLERGGKKDPLDTEIRKSIIVLELWLKEMCGE